MAGQNSRTNLSTQPYRGTRDLFPDQMQKIRYVFEVWRAVAESYGYEEYLGPLLEEKALYAAKSGEELVSEQLYAFIDRGDREVAIRPEMTPTVARMIAQQINQLPKPVRWFSIANFMRYEKPQRGRIREFFQLNMDIFGSDEVGADFEVIESAVRIMEVFNAEPHMYQIRLNHRQWMDFWVHEILDFAGETKSIMQVVDRLEKDTPAQVQGALQKLGLTTAQIDSLLGLKQMKIDEVAKYQSRSIGAQRLVELHELLTKRGISDNVQYSGTTVRGLEYYTGTVFEQFDLTPENNRSMFGGGRYDDLVSLFGGEPITAIGYAPGDVTTMLFLDSWDLWPDFQNRVDVLVTVFNEDLRTDSWQLASSLRERGLRTELFLATSVKLTDQLRYAQRKGIEHVLVLGPDEVAAGKVTWRKMTTGEQQQLSSEQLQGELISQIEGVE